MYVALIAPTTSPTDEERELFTRDFLRGSESGLDPTAAWAAAAAFLSAASFLAMVVEMSSLDCEHVDMRGRARPIFPVGAGPCGNVGPKALENVASPRTLFANVVAQ